MQQASEVGEAMKQQEKAELSGKENVREAEDEKKKWKPLLAPPIGSIHKYTSPKRTSFKELLRCRYLNKK